jgi:hypothetical protein
VIVVLLANKPMPLALSAALPPNDDGPVPAGKFVPSPGEVTDAVTGATVSIVMLNAADTAEVFPNASVDVAVMLWAPSLRGDVMVMPLALV